MPANKKKPLRITPATGNRFFVFFEAQPMMPNTNAIRCKKGNDKLISIKTTITSLPVVPFCVPRKTPATINKTSKTGKAMPIAVEAIPSRECRFSVI